MQKAKGFTAREEKVARLIASSRGIDPEGQVIIQRADGGQDEFETAWHGYVPLSRSILEAVAKG
jgi:hypothetical protein